MYIYFYTYLIIDAGAYGGKKVLVRYKCLKCVMEFEAIMYVGNTQEVDIGR